MRKISKLFWIIKDAHDQQPYSICAKKPTITDISICDNGEWDFCASDFEKFTGLKFKEMQSEQFCLISKKYLDELRG